MNPETSTVTASHASFRDPGGRVFVLNDRAIRVVGKEGQENLDCFLRSAAIAKLTEKGQIVSTRRLQGEAAEEALSRVGAASQDVAAVLDHERLEFPSYAYEWSPSMLAAAAHLTLDMAEQLLAEGLGLKDATPYNVLFRGPEPVFIDVLSIEPRDPHNDIWLPYAQFVRTFLLPLLANKHFGLPLAEIFVTHRDGLEPEDVYRMAGPLQRLLPPFLGQVSLPKWLASKAESEGEKLYKARSVDPARAEFSLRSLLKRLRKAIESACADARASRWSNYVEAATHYTAEQQDEKQKFVRDFCEQQRPERVLDVGCNTGVFSRIAAAAGARVVAIDYDAEVIDSLWREAAQQKISILPLVVNLSRPSPALGWRNRENPSFLDRAEQRFDAILMLAVIHHLLVTERVPLREIIALAAEMTTRFAVIEYVGPADPMFRKLTRGRDALHASLTPQVFEAECSVEFEIIQKQPIAGTERCLYLLRRR